jgi:hypothetical protein
MKIIAKKHPYTEMKYTHDIINSQALRRVNI